VCYVFNTTHTLTVNIIMVDFLPVMTYKSMEICNSQFWVIHLP